MATDGRVSLQANARPADATDDTLNAPRGAAARDASAQSTTVIGIDYTSTPYLGATKTWTSADGCYGGASFQSVMPSAWNNVIRSSLTFGGCSTSRHYDSATYSGSSIACSPNCASMGAMDQKTSSERWTP